MRPTRGFRRDSKAEATATTLAAQASTTARDMEEASAAREWASEGSLRARIAENRQWRTLKVIAKEQSRAGRAMSGLPPKEHKGEDSDRSDSSGSEQIRIDPLCCFDRCCHKAAWKGKGKGKGGRG